MKILAALLRSCGAFRKQFMSAHLKYEALLQGLASVPSSSGGRPTQRLAPITEEWRPTPGYEAGLRASSGNTIVVPPMERRLVAGGKPLSEWEAASLPSVGQWVLTDTEVGRGLVAMANDATSPGWAFVGTLAVNLVSQLNEVSLAAALLLPGVGALGTTGRAFVVGAIAGLAGKQVADGIYEIKAGNVGSGSAERRRSRPGGHGQSERPPARPARSRGRLLRRRTRPLPAELVYRGAAVSAGERAVARRSREAGEGDGDVRYLPGKEPAGK
jgi:hypothetical protein